MTEGTSFDMDILTTKACTKCGMVLQLDAFPVEKRRASGYSSACKGCRRARYQEQREVVLAQVKAYASRNRATILAKKKARYDANPEAARARQAESYQRNRAKRMASAAAKRATPEYAAEAAARTAAWRTANPERYVAGARRYREMNPERRAATVRAWLDANPDKAKAIRVRRRAAETGAAFVHFTAEQLNARLGYYGRCCWMCRGPYEHIDHVKPLSKGGSNVLANLRPACASCNLSKKDKWYGVAGLYRFIK